MIGKMKIHKIKTWEQFMMDVATGKKPFEIRFNDREYEFGDKLILCGWNNHSEEYTGEEIEADITYILNGGQFGIEPGYVVIGIKVITYNF